tara:strand:+ start:3582 stop:3782 length:201 start_codon:yes stop_codon:yes gene_type:complete
VNVITKVVRRNLSRKIPSRGLGDSIEKITKATGIKAVVDKVSKVTETPCGCKERRDTLNRLFPYKK